MNPEKFGDHHDWVKKGILSGLKEGEWAYHPMYFANNQPDFSAQCVNFLNSDIQRAYLLNDNFATRQQLLPDCRACPNDLFLDPDTGLWWDHNNNHVAMEELVAIGNADGRRDRLTLVYDQSIDRTRNALPRLVQLHNKLGHALANHIHGVGYVAPLIAFFWFSATCQALNRATQRFLQVFGIPPCRLMDDGCGHFNRWPCQYCGNGPCYPFPDEQAP